MDKAKEEKRQGAINAPRQSFNKHRNIGIHPTQIPAWIAVIWFVIGCFIIVMLYLLDFQIHHKYLLLGLAVPTLILYGYSGLLMIIRKEAVWKFGIIYKGFWAVVTGILAILFGWGGSIALLVYSFYW